MTTKTIDMVTVLADYVERGEKIKKMEKLLAFLARFHSEEQEWTVEPTRCDDLRWRCARFGDAISLDNCPEIYDELMTYKEG